MQQNEELGLVSEDSMFVELGLGNEILLKSFFFYDDWQKKENELK